MKHYQWSRVWNSEHTGFYYDIHIKDDGSLHNPNGYPEDAARAAALAADERKHQRLSDSSKKAGEIRKRRQEQKIAEIARDFLLGLKIGNGRNCAICGRALSDPTSIKRGVGSECWPRLQDSLAKRA